MCHSDQRGEKEKAMLSRAEERLVTDIEKLSIRIEKGRLKDPVKMQRAIGRIRAKHPRAARFYTIELKETVSSHPHGKDKINGKKSGKSKISHQLRWHRDDERIEIEEDLHGSYVLRTSRKDLSPERLWKLYITLT